ncbi:MAG: prolipoprotein diacylglyceryl transferase [Defluviitaleaceae bacterium]|nr:prolipoprotein diacylglyceryl transferase [Defluviitaleaceae bacterium]
MSNNFPPDVMFPNLGIQISNLPREAFSLFGLSVYWYGLLITLGVLCGVLYAYYEAKRTGQDPNNYMDFAIIAIITCIIGARIYYVMFSWELYRDNIWAIFNLRLGGLAIYGVIIAAIATAYFFAKFKKLNIPVFFDTAVPGLVIGQVIGRFGNFFNREAFGGYTDSLFAMRYLVEDVSFIPYEVARNIVMFEGARYIQVHPTFLYESIGCLLIFIMLNLYKTRKKFDGELLLIYLTCYGILRAVIEGMRTDQLLLWGTNMAVSQILSVLAAIFGVSMIVFVRRRTAAKGV